MIDDETLARAHHAYAEVDKPPHVEALKAALTAALEPDAKEGEFKLVESLGMTPYDSGEFHGYNILWKGEYVGFIESMGEFDAGDVAEAMQPLFNTRAPAEAKCLLEVDAKTFERFEDMLNSEEAPNEGLKRLMVTTLAWESEIKRGKETLPKPPSQGGE